MDEGKSGEATSLVPVSEARAVTEIATVVTVQDIEAGGLMMPLLPPEQLRAAFAQRQQILTSILDPNRDMLYSIKYKDTGGNERSHMCNTLREAIEFASKVSSTYSAHPKKSGVMKLAHALGVEARVIETDGLPKVRGADYAMSKYMATHKRTGRSEEGTGTCYMDERGGLKKHACVSMADTRAFCKAVLKCIGYDNVGADEIEFARDDAPVTINAPPVENSGIQALPLPAAETITSAMKAAAPAKAEPQTVAAAPAAQPAPAAAPKPAAAPAQPMQPASGNSGSVITNAQAVTLSDLLRKKLGSTEKAQAWLKENAGVGRSAHVSEGIYNGLMKKLNEMEAP